MSSVADAAVAEVLDAVWRRDPAVVVSAPPGSGKTGLVERICAAAGLVGGERVVVATTTNAQMFDVARRLATAYPRLDVLVLTRKGLQPPEGLLDHDNLRVTATVADVPDHPGVVVATAAKLAWAQSLVRDLLIVDEAWQLPDVGFAQIAGIGERVVLVGDPGQIAPVTPIDTQRWAGREDAPHLPAPQALLARHGGGVTHIPLPATRRLPPDSVRLVGDAFYPDLPFSSLRTSAGVRLSTGRADLDREVDAGASIVQLEVRGEGAQFDPEIADVIVELVRDALDCEIETDRGWEVAGAERVGVVCAHVNQVAGVQARLVSAGLDGVLCDTAERLQGLERAVMIVWHPASGRRDPGEFTFDGGRWCVMLSRHTHLAVIVTREGTANLFAQAGAAPHRNVDTGVVAAHQGWRSHVEVRAHLSDRGRIFTAAD